ncbi:unnamed protein product [Macrosiphum euphorbiae]|uniref:Uncharacterized protein n=1 Tax=Macrosiphum euphorbiae TaxID=13131 RepID=A0AAV0X414_9HEMI|nr:unnamed protein product [Macrosiphum euphorbiae]
MPPLSLRDPRNAVLSWTNETCLRVKDTPKAREQSWFKGVFAEASQTQGLKRVLQDIENNKAEKHSKNRQFKKIIFIYKCLKILLLLCLITNCLLNNS